jgi:CubicO group peptidase (beta-lactamase class C family)
MISFLVKDGALVHGAETSAVVPWWSFTKTVLAVASLSLVRDGLVTLDEALLDGPFTLRQLLRHEAGLADYGELADYHHAVARNETPWPEEEMLQRLDAGKLRYEPGAGWRYSNVGYLYVARLIERLTDLPLEEALAERAFTPLGLRCARLVRTRADTEDVDAGIAPGYEPGWVYHGLLVGPLSDAALFLDRVMAGRLLPATLLREMLTERTLGGPISGRPWISPGYGLGLMVGAVEGGMTVYGHTGAGPDSVVAIYRGSHGAASATCAVFHEGSDQGLVETRAVEQLLAAQS